MPLELARASLRNYRRVLLLSIGIILAVSLIAGINIGIEEISKGVLTSFIGDIPYDMTLTQQDPNASYVQTSQQLRSLTEITRVETVVSWSQYFDANLTSSGGRSLTNTQFALVGVNQTFASRYNVTVVQGSWNLTQGLILPDALATLLNMKPGDALNVTLRYYNRTAPSGSSYWNTRIPVAGVAVFGSLAGSMIFGFYANLSPTQTGITPNSGGFPILMSYDTLLSSYRSYSEEAAKTGVFSGSGNFQIFYRIFLNRSAVISPFDADSTLARLANIENSIRIQLGIGYVQDHVADAIYSYRGWLQGNLVGFYFFSLPVLPITWYLAMTSWYMVTARRRQEIGLLKVRGVSSRQIFRATLLESFVIGIIGSGLGVLAGFGVGTVVAFILGSQSSPTITPGAITPDVLGFSMFVGVGISILAALRPARLAANLEPTEAVKEYQGEEMEAGKPWRPTWTWGAVILGTYKMLEWLFSFGPTTLLPYGAPGGSFILTILFFIWVSLSGILIFLGPFLFVYGVTKIVTRSQNRLYRSTALMLRVLLKDMARVTARALSRNPARASRIAFLIALTITFGIFVNVVSASSWDLTVRSNRLQIGADVNVKTFSSSINESFVSNLTSVQGIRLVTPILTSSANTPYSGAGNIEIYGINPNSFLDVAFAAEDFAIGDPASLLQKMQSSSNATLVSQPMANFLNLKVGDTIQITSNSGSNTTNPVSFVVLGVFKAMPGIGTFGPVGPIVGPGGFSGYLQGGAIIASLSYLRKTGFSSYTTFTFLCKLNPKADPTTVATTIRDTYGQNVADVETFQDRMQQLTSNAAATSIFKFLQLTSAYLFVAAVIGFALISWANTRERLREIAVFRSRGASRKQALQILFAESFVILVLAIIIGAATGVLSAYGVLVFITSTLSGQALSGISLRLVAPPELWIMIGASIAGFLLSILLAAWLSLRKTVVQTIRFR